MSYFYVHVTHINNGQCSVLSAVGTSWSGAVLCHTCAHFSKHAKIKCEDTASIYDWPDLLMYVALPFWITPLSSFRHHPLPPETDAVIKFKRRCQILYRQCLTKSFLSLSSSFLYVFILCVNWGLNSVGTSWISKSIWSSWEDVMIEEVEKTLTGTY